jgi:hypothetical protein
VEFYLPREIEIRVLVYSIECLVYGCPPSDDFDILSHVLGVDKYLVELPIMQEFLR